MKNLFAKLKTFFDAYKMYVFFMALLFGTNGAQMYVHSEPEKAGPPIEKVKPVAINPVRTETIIIHKSDNEYVDRKLEEHKTGAQH